MKSEGAPCWDDLDVVTQANLIAFDQTRQYEESEMQKAMFGASSKPVNRLPTRGKRRRRR